MAETYNRLNLDVNVKPGGIITAVQKDSDSRYLDVNLFNNGVPIDLTGHEVRIYMRKPENGGEIFNDGEITEPENGRCQFLLTTDALEKVGHLQTQISIWKDNKEILSTQIFEIMVTESLRTTGSIEGSNEYGALVVLFQNLYESMDLMTDMVQNFGTAGAVAAGIPADTFWKMLEAVYQVNKDALENASVSEVLNRIGLMGDTGGSQTAGTVFGKENAILKALTMSGSQTVGNYLEKIYRAGLFYDVTVIEQASINVNESVPKNTTTESKRLLKTVVLEHDFYLISAMASASISGSSTGTTHAKFIVAVNDIEIPAFSAYASKSSSRSGTYYYNNLFNTWVNGGDYILTNGSPSGLYPTSFAIEKFFLFRKGTTLKIYSTSTNSDTTYAGYTSATLKGCYIKI